MDRLKRWLEKNWQWIILFLSMIIVVKITEEVFKQEIIKKDLNFYYWIIDSFRNEKMTQFMKIITMFGSTAAIIIFAIFPIFIIKNKQKGLCMMINPLIIMIFNQSLKGIIQRKRPSEFFLVIEKGFSFPSGHSAVSAAFYGFIIYLIYQYVKNRKVKIVAISFLTCLILLIGFSRIYLGAHYLSDVVAGFLISLSYLIIYIKIVGKYIDKKEKCN